MEFKVGNHVYLRVRLKKISLRLGNCAKLAPSYYGPFEFHDRIGLVAYRIAFPSNMRAHDVFRVYLLKKCVHDPKHVINSNMIYVETK